MNGPRSHRDYSRAETAQMLDNNGLMREAERVRRAFEILARQDGGKLKAFPSQCCDIATRVLGLRLYDAGLRGFSEHLGYAQDDQLHRWLHVDGVVVDITADQFGEPSVVVSADSRWHRERAVQERILFDGSRAVFLRSEPMADYTRQVFGRITEIVEGGQQNQQSAEAVAHRT